MDECGRENAGASLEQLIHGTSGGTLTLWLLRSVKDFERHTGVFISIRNDWL